jgi:ABC-type transport system involved in multi-copper enzyme maturation permease subunit
VTRAVERRASGGARFAAVLRYELAYQLRRPWPWLGFAALFLFTLPFTRTGVVPVTLTEDFRLNAPFVITAVTVLTSLLWLMIAPVIAGEAAARDAQTRMDQLVFTTGVARHEYLFGRWLAALLLSLLVLLGTQVGSLMAVLLPGVPPELVGPIRAGPYLAAFAYIALPNAIVGTTLQFAAALAAGRAMASYAASVLLLFLSVPVSAIISFPLAQPAIGKLTDPMGFIAIWNAVLLEWTIAEKYTRTFTLEGASLHNRLLWLAIAALVLAVLYARFRFAYRMPFVWRGRQVVVPADAPAANAAVRRAPESAVALVVPIPAVRRDFGLRAQLRQLVAITAESYGAIARSPAGVFLLLVFPAFVLLVLTLDLEALNIPLLPRTGYLLSKHLTGAALAPENYWLLLPLLIIHFSGELHWRERDAGLGDTIDTLAIPGWVSVLGKYLGLALIVATVLAATAAAGLITQLRLGYDRHELGLWLFTLFGLQLPDYLIFAALAFFVHALVNQKYGGQLLALVLYVLLIVAPLLGLEHPMLRYGSSPGWSYTDLRGFGNSLAPWAWLHAWWAGWALLLGVGTLLLWSRGREGAIRARLHGARMRVTPGVRRVAGLAAVIVVACGSVTFYNTNILHAWSNATERDARAAEYERRFGAAADAPQPAITHTRLEVDLAPSVRRATVTGTYHLVNPHSAPITEVHVGTSSGVTTRVTFDRVVARVDDAPALEHTAYMLAEPLAPGDSLTLEFTVEVAPRGFRASGAINSIVANGTHITGALLPSIGYDRARELIGSDARRKQGLPRKVTLPTPDDVHPTMLAGRAGTFEAIVHTDPDQVAVAPGTLRRRWTEGGRRHFHYASDEPIGGLHQIFSARYAEHHEQWGEVALSVFTHPDHALGVDRIAKSARASLAYYSEQFGAYPYRFLQFVEQPAPGLGMGVDGSGVVTVLEGATLFDTRRIAADQRDGLFEIAAHEVAHQWWGGQVTPAMAEGGIILSESLAWYSAMRVIRREKGQEVLRQFMWTMRQPYPWPPIRTGLPLLRAVDPYAGYRRGPFAFYALSEYAGESVVNGALRALVGKHRGRSTATTNDLYHELQAAVPDSLHPLLHDLFAATTFWHFDTKGATARAIGDGRWEVTFDISARKVVSDTAGKEVEVPIAEDVELAVFAAAEPGAVLGRRLYLGRHRLVSGAQHVTVIVNAQPARGGVDPYNLLDWDEGDNIETIAIAEHASPG